MCWDQEYQLRPFWMMLPFLLILFFTAYFYYYWGMHYKETGHSAQKLKNFKAKLLAVDSYIKNNQKLPDTMFMHPELLEQMYGEKPAYEIKNKLKLKQSKSIIFKDFSRAVFEFYYTDLEKDKKYCVHFAPSQTILSVKVVYDGLRKRHFQIKRTQTVVLVEEDWKKVQLTVYAKKTTSFSMVKIQMDTIKTEFKSKDSHVIPPQKKIVEKELEEYIRANHNPKKIKEILEKRKSKSLTRLTSLRSAHYSSSNTLRSRNGSLGAFKSTSTQFMKPLVSEFNDRKIQSAQTKRDLVAFQGSKVRYLNHLNKMSPQKSQQIKKYQAEYNQEKKQSAQSLVHIIFAVKFLNHVNLIGIQSSRKKMMVVQTNLLCQKFVKNLTKVNKMRLPMKSRIKGSVELNLKVITCLMYHKTVEKAENRLYQCFQIVMLKNDVNKISKKCEIYREKMIRIQRFFRKKREIYIQRFTILAQVIKGRMFQNNQQKMQCFREYMQLCRTYKKPLKYNFLIHHKKVQEILLKYRETSEGK